MECVYISEAKYIKNFKIFLKFNTGESGDVDLKDIIYKYKTAEPLRDPVLFSRFYLDSWPTLAWSCGFDIAPESLHSMITTKNEIKSTAA
jgi:hypothetical protein